jgi:hypothetical protein
MYRESIRNVGSMPITESRSRTKVFMVKKWKPRFKILNLLIENSNKLFFFLASTGHWISSLFLEDHFFLPI